MVFVPVSRSSEMLAATRKTSGSVDGALAMHAALSTPLDRGHPALHLRFHTAALIAAGMFLAASVATPALIPRPGDG
jgi:hypothetical protein